MRKNCSSDRKKLLKFETEGREFAKKTQTVKGQSETNCLSIQSS